jgi:hypothetical protein
MTGYTRNESHPGIACGICARLIPLETTKTDETGNSVHEECYVRHTILRFRTPTYPSYPSPPTNRDVTSTER